jgi:hypothetical protein
MTVQLRSLHPAAVDDVDDARRVLVAEHADGEDLGRQAPGDVVGDLRGDLAR